MLSFRLLGEVVAEADGRPVDVGHPRQRAVLAVLLLEVNRTVPLDSLIDRVWGERLPKHPRDALYGYVSRLRACVPIHRSHAGYVLSADPMSVDVHRFVRLTEQARTVEDDQSALDMFDQALGLWRGTPFASLDSLWLSGVGERLKRQRHAAKLDRNDLRLRLGLHDRVLAETPAEATTNERLAGQVMLALHHGGRQADALRYFEQVRSRLAEELGTDPHSDLREIQYQILTASTPPTAAPPMAAPPRQLPASSPSFSGRTRELARLDDLLGTARIVAITGGGGMGKTWLALRWAQDNVDRFPDGQLYVNLRGFDPAGEPVRSEIAVRGLLDGLGAAPASIPAGLEAQSALFRSMTANRRMLIVLDNAKDTAQVTPLLPGGESCTTVVASRNQLTALLSTHAASPLTLPLLTDAESADLLTRRLGHTRMAAEPTSVREILRCCGGLPLALGIVAARAASGASLVTLAAELRAARLDALDSEELTASLRAVFSMSYTALDDETAQAFRLLALAPGADIGLPAAIALIAPGNAGRLIGRLTAAHLVQEHQPGRFRLHDLVRLYATELAHDNDRAAPTRLVNYYLHASSAAMDRFAPTESYRRPTVAEPVCPAPEFASFEQARDWLDTERPNLVAAGATDRTGRLAMTLFRYLENGAHYHDALALHTNALTLTQPDQPEHGYALHHRGFVLARLGRDDEALTHHERALRHAQNRHDTVLETCAAVGMATTYERQREYETALGYYQRTLVITRRDGHRHREGIILNDLGQFYRLVGQYDNASETLRQGLAIASELKDLGLGAYILSNLGDVYACLGQHEKAIDHMQRALGIARDLGNRGLEAAILNDLGQASHSPDYYHQALALARDIGSRPEQTRAQEGLNTLQHPPGQT